MDLMIQDKVYVLSEKPADRYGLMRFNLIQQGSDDKPHSMSFDPVKYRDSVVPGWGCSCKGWIIKRGPTRTCKHVIAVSQAFPHLRVG